MKALLFYAGGIRLALRLAQVREILPAQSLQREGPGDRPMSRGEVVVRGQSMATVPVAVILGLPPRQADFALVTEASPPVALGVDAVEGIVALTEVEVYRLPTRTALPQPPPFEGAMVVKGEVSLELAPGNLGFAPLEPAGDGPPPAQLPAESAQRELYFVRLGRVFAVPVPLLLQVFEAPVVWPVPLTAPSHRGLLYHGRSLHPVFDVAPMLDRTPPQTHWFQDRPPMVLLLDAGGTALGVIADRVLGVGEGAPAKVIRLAWDALFPAQP
jgi:chemotaxis signal transduction protein